MGKKSVRSNQSGIILPFIILVVVGVVGFIVIASSAEFKNQLFGKLFPKQASFAQTCTQSSKNFEATLNKDGEIPPTSSLATAGIYMYLDPTDSTKLNYSLGAIGLPVSQITAMHIHSPAGVGGSAAPSVTLYDTTMGSIVFPYNRTVTLPANVLADILVGNAYVNIHTNSLPNGEIRGQITCSASTATLSLSAPTTQFSVNQQIPVTVKAKADTDYAGVFDARLTFDKTKLEAVSIDTNGSPLGLWTERVFDNNNGTVTLIGGATPPGQKTNGSEITLATIQFKVKAIGNTNISVDKKSAIQRISDSINILSNAALLTVNNSTQTTQKSAYFTWQGSTTVTNGQQFTLNLMGRSDTDAANLFDGKFSFPSALEVVSIDTTGSAITQWVEQFYDNSTGKLSIIGGLPNPGLKTTSDVLIAKVTFKAKSVQTATISPDNGMAIYRNSDNVDIWDNTRNQAFVVTISQVSASPSPSASPSSSPVSSPSPASSASSAPSACAINSATWVSTRRPANLGDIVTLKVLGNNFCDGQTVSFEVRESDLVGSGAVTVNPQSTTFRSDHTAISSWVAEFQDDSTLGLGNPPEYYFMASLPGSSGVKSADPLLEVIELLSGVFRKGDGNRDGIVNIVDVSVLFTNWNRTSGFPAELDTNDDSAINVFDFSGIVLILRSTNILN